MSTLKIVALLAALLFVGIFFFDDTLQIKDLFAQYVENGEIQTFETRFTPQQIMEKSLSKHTLSQDSLKEPVLKYHPYLLMEVKFTDQNQKSQEGAILWGLVDGEMVLNTENWEKTHGFEDTILANATASDFRVLNSLAKHQGFLTLEELQKELKIETPQLDTLIESVRRKQLVLQRGNALHLHLTHPKILVYPYTTLNHLLVTKPYGHTERLPKKYSRSQIEKISKATFGTEFAIRHMSEVFLPVYSIESENADGSHSTTLWNAVTGEYIPPKYLRGRNSSLQ